MVLRRHGHRREDRRRRSRAVRSAGGARVVLAAAPGETDARVADGVALHLIDGHLSGMALDELDETAALPGGNLDVGDFAEALEEGAKLVLGDVAGKTTDEDSGVVGVGELVHRLRGTIVTHRRSTHGVHAHLRRTTGHRRGITGTDTLGGSGGDAHGTVTAVNALHLGQSTVLILLVRKTNEAVATRHAADGVGHDLSGLARREARLEQRDQDVFVDLGAEITDEDGVLRATVITRWTSVRLSIIVSDHVPSVGETATGSPVELERTSAVRDLSAVEGQSLGSGSWVLELNEAVASVTIQPC